MGDLSLNKCVDMLKSRLQGTYDWSELFTTVFKDARCL